MAQYLLPCDCGNKIVVEPRQAGETLRCPCGAPITAPPMLQLKTLEPAPVDRRPEAPASRWGARQGLLLSGVLVVAVAVGLAVVLYQHRPVHPELRYNSAEVRQRVGQLSPLQSWRAWQTLRQRGLMVASPQDLEAYRGAVLQWRLSAVLVGLLAIGGIALIIVGASLRTPSDRPGSGVATA